MHSACSGDRAERGSRWIGNRLTPNSGFDGSLSSATAAPNAEDRVFHHLVLQEVGRGTLDPEAHFMVASEPKTPSRVPVFRTSYGVTMLVYPAGEHHLVEASLRDLVGLVLGAREARAPAPG